MPYDWQQFHADNTHLPAVVDPQRRLRICLAGFAVLTLVVFSRAVQLEVTQGAGFRAAALRPIERETVLPAARGRILARDGTVLAYDRALQAVAVEYRWLEEPADDGWLLAQARARLPKADRKNAKRLAAARSEVLAERKELAGRLAALCGLSSDQWEARVRRIQARVGRIAEAANRPRQSETAGPAKANDSWTQSIRRLLWEDLPPPRIVVTEELDHHVMADDVSAAVVAEIENHPDRYPGTKIVSLSRRTYPEGTLAAHVLGHLGAAEEEDSGGQTFLSAPPDRVGRMGVERQYETLLRGQPGVAVQQLDHGGRAVHSYCRQEPTAGRDLELTLDVRLQRTAEQLLQSAKEVSELFPGGKGDRSNLCEAPSGPSRQIGPVPFSAGGAIVVMDVRDGRHPAPPPRPPSSIPICLCKKTTGDSPRCWPIRRSRFSTARAAWPFRPARRSRWLRPRPCWNRAASIRSSRSPARATCTSPTGSDAISTSAKASATER